MTIAPSLVIAVEDELSGAVMCRLISFSGRNFIINRVFNARGTLEDPKRTLINLARRSRKRRLSQEIVPEAGSSAKIGALYNTHFINFVNSGWDIEQACLCAPSLARTLSRIFTFLPV